LASRRTTSQSTRTSSVIFVSVEVPLQIWINCRFPAVTLSTRMPLTTSTGPPKKPSSPTELSTRNNERALSGFHLPKALAQSAQRWPMLTGTILMLPFPAVIAGQQEGRLAIKPIYTPFLTVSKIRLLVCLKPTRKMWARPSCSSKSWFCTRWTIRTSVGRSLSQETSSTDKGKATLCLTKLNGNCWKSLQIARMQSLLKNKVYSMKIRRITNGILKRCCCNELRSSRGLQRRHRRRKDRRICNWDLMQG